MPQCKDCEFFVPVSADDSPHPTIMGRCNSPMFEGMRAAFVSGNNPEYTVPCRLHTKKF